MVTEQTTWLITGGCGFIGKRLVKTIRESYPQAGIRVFDNLCVGTREELSKHDHFVEIEQAETRPPSGVTELVVGDIRDHHGIENATKGCDVVVHLAANTGVAPSVEDPFLDCNTNVSGTLNTLEAARKNGSQRFIFASSGAPVGECTPPIHEEMPCRPVSPYGASKLAGEGYCSAYFGAYGLETTCLRFGNVYGPGCSHKSSVVAKFIQRANAGKKLEIYGDGTQTRDFIYIDDLISAIIAAAIAADIGGETFQIATASENSVSDIANLLQPLLAAKGIKANIEHCEPRKGDVTRNFSNTHKAQQLLDWRAQTTLHDGLAHTIDALID